MIRALLIAVLLTACGGGGGDNNPAPPPEPPTGGTTPPPPPPPPAGTVVEAYCDNYTFVEVVNDGEGGTYLAMEEDSPQCNYAPVEVSIQGVGTYFKPVTVTVTGAWDGEYETTIGRVSTNAVGIEIYSDGRIGGGNVTIDGQSYAYTIEEDPICENTGIGQRYKTDCLGNETGGRSSAMIYYEDTQVVQIEVGFVRSTSRYPTAVTGTRVPDDHEVRKEVEAFVKYANDFNERSGVYIEFVISDVVWEDPWQSIYDFGGGSPALLEISDIVYGWGGAGANHGQAFQPASIYAGMPTQKVVGLTLGGTALHELGHGMGLGHGPWGLPDWTLEDEDPLTTTGSIFPRFGHGWSGKIGEGVCGAQGSVMSYSTKIIWTNSLLSCEALGYPAGAWGDAAGSRQQSDEAYALNRVRYTLSLVHNEHLYGQVDPVVPDAPDAEEPEEPPVWVGDTCPRTGSLETGLVDCQGYAVTTAYPEEGYTYYGEGDTTVVTWEVALLMFKDCPSSTFGPQSFNEGICDDPMTQQEMDKAEEIIATMQERFDLARIYVRLELKHARMAYFSGVNDIPVTDFNVDAVLAFGGSSPQEDGQVICGYAGFNGNFRNPLRPWGICGVKDLMHELGHTVGLAHGPQNSRNANTGYTFPNFGHGGGTSVCGSHGSIMSYDVGSNAMWSNSLYPCYEVAPSGYSTKMAGIRGPNGYDEAYVFNRVRYNVANINGE